MRLLRAKSNSLLSNSLFIFLIRFFPSLANVLVVVLFSRMLDRPSYGAYQGFWTHLIVISAIACMGVQSFMLTYKPDVIRLLLRRISSGFYLGFGMWMVVCSVILALLHHDTFGIGWLIPFLYLTVYACSTICESLLIAFRRYANLVWVNFVHTGVFCSLHWLLIEGTISWIELFIYLLLLAGCRLLIYIISLFRETKKKPGLAELNRPISDFLSLWMHLGVYDVTQVLFRWIDKAIIAFIVGEELFALYYNGSIDIPFLPLLLGAVAGAGLMRLANTHAATDEQQTALSLVNRTGRLLSCIVFPLFFFFVCFRYELFEVVLSEKYIAAVPIFLVSVMVMPLRAYSFTTVLQNRHKGSVINIGAIADLLLACVMMYPLYLWLGLPGVALSFVVSSYLQAAYYLYHTGAVLDVSIARLIPLKNWLFKLIVFGCLFIGVHYLLAPYYDKFIVLFWGIVLVIVTALASLWLEYKKASQHGRSA